MQKNKFFQTIEERWARGMRVCVGLDPDKRKMSPRLLESKKSSSPILELNEKVISATKDIALCYKLNRAFYPGPEGMSVLHNTIAHIRNAVEGAPVIYDAKFGDIGNTNNGYVEETFEWLKADAVTLHHTMGKQAMLPFLEHRDKGIFVLCRTSNEGSDEFQDIIVDSGVGPMPMYLYVAHQVMHHWNYNNNCGLVMGATYPSDLAEVRRKMCDTPILIPGLGSQDGDVHDAVHAGITKKRCGIIPSSSSGIMFADDPKVAAQRLAAEINDALDGIK